MRKASKQDITVRNLRAIKKKLVELERRVKAIESRSPIYKRKK